MRGAGWPLRPASALPIAKSDDGAGVGSEVRGGV